jgi:hypothetical protein
VYFKIIALYDGHNKLQEMSGYEGLVSVMQLVYRVGDC